MWRAVIFVFILVDFAGLHGQSFFNIQPDVGGNDMQGVCRAIILHDSTFNIIGHRFDTIGPGSNIKPWLGNFNYQGELLNVYPLIDTSYTSPFYSDLVLLTQKKENIYYAYLRRSLGGSFYTPYLFEFNISTGEIIKSILLPNTKYPNIENGQSSIIYNQDNTITLLSYVYLADSVKTFITQVDTFFNIQKFIEVESIEKSQFPYTIKYNNDNSFSIIGDIFDKNYYIKIDTFGHIIKYKVAPTTLPIAFFLANTHTVTEDSHGNWILAGHHYIDHSDSCFQCHEIVPYIYSVSSIFDSLLWQTRFFDIPHEYGPHYSIYSMTKMNDGYVVSGSFRDYGGKDFPDSGLLFKASNNGDSLWMKHYIPLNWEDNRVVWAKLQDVKTTPFNTIIAAGEISDRELQIIRPWIIHVDSDGCLVPGCNSVSTDDENIIDDKKEYFKIYPNPASEELYLLSAITSSDPVNIQVVSNDGIILKSRNFNPQNGFQYILPIDELPSGVYHLLLTNRKNHLSESHSFIRQ